MSKLNIGCGSSKIEGFVNIDKEESIEPDLVFDIEKEDLPFDDESIEIVVMYHTIEHIKKASHKAIFSRVNKVLAVGGIFVLSYPEWRVCVKNYLENKKGEKEFWEATLYGRQLYPSDYHVCIIETDYLVSLAKDYGFGVKQAIPEISESYNSILILEKVSSPLLYEQVLKEQIWPQEMNLQDK